MRWRPVLSITSLLSGLLLGVGSSLLLQQYSVQVLTRAALIRTVVVSLAVAVLVPSVARWIGVRRYRRAVVRAGLAS
jgi:hypothetical protein